MNLKQQLAEYWREIVFLVKNNWIALLCILVISTVLEFTSVSFLSIFLMIILVAVLSKTSEYKSGKCKICNFFLYFLFMILFVMMFAVPATVFLIGLDITEIEQIASSNLIKTSVNVGVWISLIFVFAPYRIFDANVNIIRALKYSNSVVVNNPVIFLILLVFTFVITFFTIDLKHADFISYMLIVISTVSLYKLNVKKSLQRNSI